MFMSKALDSFKNILREIGTPYFSTLYDFDDWKYDVKVVYEALLKLEDDKHE